MGTKTVEVDVDLEDFSIDELLEEIEDRFQWHGDKKTITNFFKDLFEDESELPTSTIEDGLRLQLFKEATAKYSLTELENRLK